MCSIHLGIFGDPECSDNGEETGTKNALHNVCVWRRGMRYILCFPCCSAARTSSASTPASDTILTPLNKPRPKSTPLAPPLWPPIGAIGLGLSTRSGASAAEFCEEADARISSKSGRPRQDPLGTPDFGRNPRLQRPSQGKTAHVQEARGRAEPTDTPPKGTCKDILDTAAACVLRAGSS